MLPEKIMQSDFLDILFENRNKSYGAYAIRKSYNKTLLSATGFTFIMATVFAFLQFINNGGHAISGPMITLMPDLELVKIDLPQKPAEPILNKPVEFKINQKIFSKPVITNENFDTQMPTTDELEKNIIGAKNIIGKNDDGIIPPPATTATGTGNVAPKTEAVVEDDKPLTIAQVMPEYPGGIEALKKFMLRNLHQPDDLQPGERIIVQASFIVDKRGKIEQVIVINTGRDDLNKEVQRVINKMPLWKPGLQNGNTVAVYFKLPVTFLGGEE